MMEQFADALRDYYGDPLEPLAEQFMFRPPPTPGEMQRPPQVLLLGNHSSGKSTFVNHLLGTEIQQTGVAPTDDGFTIITYGEVESDRDGPSIVSNPDLPYEGLRAFGDQLVSHVRLKLRPASLLGAVTLIDSPGMIDEAKAENGRGYDFPGVVRWFAERADLVLIFFDPDKPGTTGETLQVFKESLAGIDHKMLIILNKVDQFQSLHDFARAYGALCWNLGKIIPRKDLPMIYNTFVPVAGGPRTDLPMGDFEKARAELVEHLHRVPTRRMDNQITQLQAYAERLRLHSYVIEEAANRFRNRRALWRSLWFLLFGGLGAAAFATGIIIAVPVVGAVALVALLLIELLILRRSRRRLASRLDQIFEKLYERDLMVRERAEDLRDLWNEVRARAQEIAEKRGLQEFEPLMWRDRELLDELIDDHIPNLRGDLYAALKAMSSTAGPQAAEPAPAAPSSPPSASASPSPLPLSGSPSDPPEAPEAPVRRRVFPWGRGAASG
ncbi:MAG: dynamin family protein [Pseudomonadota bacterium]